MGLAFELDEKQLHQFVSIQLINGELGDKIAEKLALMQAEVMTYNPTQAAQLLNISRNTIYELINAGKLKFTNGRISLARLLEFRRESESSDESQRDKTEIAPFQPKARRRTLK